MLIILEVDNWLGRVGEGKGGHPPPTAGRMDISGVSRVGNETFALTERGQLAEGDPKWGHAVVFCEGFDEITEACVGGGHLGHHAERRQARKILTSSIPTRPLTHRPGGNRGSSIPQDFP